MPQKTAFGFGEEEFHNCQKKTKSTGFDGSGMS